MLIRETKGQSESERVPVRIEGHENARAQESLFGRNKEQGNEKGNECLEEQGWAENAFRETKGAMLEQHRMRMSENQVSALEKVEDGNQIKVLSEKDYGERFPKVNANVLGHCDSEGNIYIKKRSEAMISHIATHETMHRCARRELQASENDGASFRSGLHEVRTGAEGTVEDVNRGINEGVTEMYTLRELSARGETEATQSITAYSESRMWAMRLEELVGADKVADAYFGQGQEGLKEAFNQLDTEHEDGWRKFSKNIDVVEYGADLAEVAQAQQELAEQYISMLLKKDVMGEGEP